MNEDPEKNTTGRRNVKSVLAHFGLNKIADKTA